MSFLNNLRLRQKLTVLAGLLLVVIGILAVTQWNVNQATGAVAQAYQQRYTSYMLATGAIKGEVGETFTAGRMGDFTIEADPGREGAKRVLMGPFTVYNKDNVEAASK